MVFRVTQMMGINCLQDGNWLVGHGPTPWQLALCIKGNIHGIDTSVPIGWAWSQPYTICINCTFAVVAPDGSGGQMAGL